MRTLGYTGGCQEVAIRFGILSCYVSTRVYWGLPGGCHVVTRAQVVVGVFSWFLERCCGC